MIQTPYPTGERNFVISPLEIGLPESNDPERKNNHHLYWEFNKLGRFLIPRTFRDLEHNQMELPVDQHTILHQRYSQPKLPSLEDMLEQIEVAHAIGERTKLQENRKGPYFYQRISDVALKQAFMEYQRLA